MSAATVHEFDRGAQRVGRDRAGLNPDLARAHKTG
jgi:hypothetical protein